MTGIRQFTRISLKWCVCGEYRFILQRLPHKVVKDPPTSEMVNANAITVTDQRTEKEVKAV